MEIPRHWRMIPERYNLRGIYDPANKTYSFGLRTPSKINQVKHYEFANPGPNGSKSHEASNKTPKSTIVYEATEEPALAAD